MKILLKLCGTTTFHLLFKSGKLNLECPHLKSSNWASHLLHSPSCWTVCGIHNNADWTRYSCHSFGATNCYWLISEKDRCQRAQSPGSQRSSHVSKSAFPDHCDEGIFQDGLCRIIPLGSAFMKVFPFPAVTAAFSLGDLNAEWVWAEAEKCPPLWVPVRAAA